MARKTQDLRGRDFLDHTRLGVRTRLVLRVSPLMVVLGLFVYELVDGRFSPTSSFGLIFYAVLLVVCLYHAGVGVSALWPYRRYKYTPDQALRMGVCPRCGYSIQGWESPDCPECGLSPGVSKDEIRRYEDHANDKHD